MKRILVIGRRHSGKLRFVRALTGSLPDVISDESHGGLIHDYRFKNRYFSANVPLWIDEITAGDQALEEFVALYSSEEGEEVMEHVGAIVLCLACDSMCEVETLLVKIKSIVDDRELDVLPMLLAVDFKPISDAEEMADLCLDEGFEYVRFGASGRNAFGECTGIERVHEALQASDYSESVKGKIEGEQENESDDLVQEIDRLKEMLLSDVDGDSDHDLDRTLGSEVRVKDYESEAALLLDMKGFSPRPL